MIMVDHQIKKAIKDRSIEMENYSEESIQPASYDLRIGPKIYTPSSPNPNKLIDLSSNGGVFSLPPYGNVIVMTYETLKLSNEIIGRIGLKSGFARKGLFASAGPQVDPGYHGKLFISLLNLVPRSQVLAYKDTFLTIEFHTLDETPEKSYTGQYQNLEDISTEILDDMMRFEGLNLSQVQTQFSELKEHVKEWSTLASRFDEFLTVMKKLTHNNSEKVSIQHEEIIETRKLSLEDAKAEIIHLFKSKPQMYCSDIAEELNLDYSLVVRASDELLKENIIEETEEKDEQE